MPPLTKIVVFLTYKLKIRCYSLLTNNGSWVSAATIGAESGGKFSKFENFHVFSRQKFKFHSENLDILPKNMQLQLSKSILSSANFYCVFFLIFAKKR